MNQPAQTLLDEPALLEEQVDTGLKPMLAGYRASHSFASERPNILNGRFVLHPERSLTQFNHPFAQAYAGEDTNHPERQVCAMVLDNTLPYRQFAMHELQGMNNPFSATLYGYGSVFCSHLNEVRMVIFVEIPQGNNLAELIKSQQRLHEHRVVDFVLQPAVRALLAMREKKISHGNIRPSAFFTGDQPMLSECFSAPCGTLGHDVYQAPELLQADALGRGEANEKIDAYALGVLAYELIFGLDRIKELSREEFSKLILTVGAYNIFATGRDFTDMLSDFFKGVFTDNPNERWGLDQLAQWLGGKRFNMITPSLGKEVTRPLVFMGEQYVSRRYIAHVFQKHWREAAKELRGMRLDRWAEISLHRPDMADRIARALRIAGEASTEKHINDMLTRIIAILDPTGPIRSVNIAARPDGFGAMLASLIHDTRSTELNQLLGFIESDVANYWSELDPANKAYEMGQSVWRLQRVRSYLKNKAFGFGLERALYELNPSLPCQAERLKQYHITSLSDLLKTLDALAPSFGEDASFADRHIAAYIATKIDMGKEVRLSDLNTIPALAHNSELIALRILAKAQQKHERLNLVGLATWAALRIEKMLNEIHNRTVRRELKLQLKRLASTGSLNEVLSALINREIMQSDHEGFARAIALHQLNHRKIEWFQNPTLINKRAQDFGGKLASSIALMSMVVVFFLVLSTSLGV